MTDTPSTLQEDQQRLAADLRAVVRDTEALLRHAADGAGQGFAEARTKLEKTLQGAKTQLAEIEEAALGRVVDAGKATDRYVRQHPWEAVGVGAALGLVVGLLIGRR
jgi:ElaB/YqjD/DUF883 family membrane-anchored ribosome-binding protein